MAIITIITLILFIILVLWSWHNLEDINKGTKIIYIIIQIMLTTIVTYVIFQLSHVGIQYPNDEIMYPIQNTLILLFTEVNGCILIPYVSKTLAKVKQNEINSKDLQKKIVIILILIILIVIVEKSYMENIQNGILQIFNQLRLN